MKWASKALGYGTLLAVSGTGLVFFLIKKAMGVNNVSLSVYGYEVSKQIIIRICEPLWVRVDEVNIGGGVNFCFLYMGGQHSSFYAIYNSSCEGGGESMDFEV